MRVKFCILLILVTGLLFGCSSTRQTNGLGLQNGQLRSCPDTPNCVSSRANNSDQQVPALQLQMAPGQAWEQVKAAITALPRTHIITATSEYIHAECRSAVFGFIDDLELHLLPKQGQIEVRSLARVGYYDFGVNRQRVEQLRSRLLKAGVIR
ncbi:MAG: DUF1499 domain-containing protein [Desulfuromonadales bacterium]